MKVALIGAGWYGKSDLFRLIQVAEVEEGHISKADCILANISIELGGRPLRYDSKTRTIVNDTEATAKLPRPYRGTWVHREYHSV